MATAEQIAQVREYTDEPTQDPHSDAELNALIDAHGVDGATAEVWRQKMARYSRLVDVSEAGASRRMSQAFEHASKMASFWEAKAGVDTSRHARVHRIERT